MITGREIKVLDKNSEYYGVPNSRLMENAGKGVADYIVKKLKPKDKEILVICGTGNNGGDGFVAARHLAKKYNVAVFLTGKERDIKTDISKNNFQKLKKHNIKIYDIDSLKKIDESLLEKHVLIDALLGIGLTGKLREPYYAIVKKINNLHDKKIISVDIPTGFGTNTAITPDATITFHDIKNGMNKKNSGDIKIVDIGIPHKAAEYIGPGELSVYYPRSKKESHKGDNGKVLVVGGGPYIGAPALAGLAALRTGADLVYIATPRRPASAITSFSPLVIKPKRLAKDIAAVSPNLIVKELTHEEKLILDDVKIVDKFIKKIDTVVIGPGLGSDKSTKQAVKKIIIKSITDKKSILIDADAVQVVGTNPSIIKNSQTVITPHAGEFKELTGIKLSNNLNERKKNVEKWAKKIGITILLKGPIDVISNGVDTKLNDTHNPGMTVGGTGDVLSGITGALLSKGVEPFNAARASAFINGAAGNATFKKRSYGLIATDIIEEIPRVLKKYL